MKFLTIKNINEGEVYPDSIINIGKIYPGNLYKLYFLFRNPFLKTEHNIDWRDFKTKHGKWRKSTLFLIRIYPFTCTKSKAREFIEYSTKI